MIHKFILLVLILFQSSNIFATAKIFPGLKKISDKGEIVVSFTPNETSMFTIVDDKKNISGIDRDVAELIAKELGVKLVVKTSAEDWNSVVSEVSRGEADIGISYLSLTSTRAKSVFFSDPYVMVRQTLVFNNLSVAQQMKNGKNVIKDMFIGDNGMKVGVFSGSSYVDFAKNLFPGVKIKELDTTKELFDAAIAREIDAILIDELEVFATFSKNPGLKVKLTEIVLKDAPDYISIAVDPQNRELLDFVNNIIKTRQISYTIESAEVYTKEKESKRVK